MSYVRKFEDIRITRWKKGREFNGLPVNSPEFVGDPMREIVEECADGCNYNNVAWNQGKYGKDYWRFQAIDNHLRAAAAVAMGAEHDASSEDTEGEVETSRAVAGGEFPHRAPRPGCG